MIHESLPPLFKLVVANFFRLSCLVAVFASKKKQSHSLLCRDSRLDSEQQQAAEKQVKDWIASSTLPFPDFEEGYRE